MFIVKSLQFKYSAFARLSAAPEDPKEEFTHEEEIKGCLSMASLASSIFMFVVKILQFEYSAFARLSAAPKDPKEEFTHEEEIKGVEGPEKEVVFPIVFTNVMKSLINLRAALNAINTRCLPLVLLVYSLVRPLYHNLWIVLSVEDKLPFLEQPIPAMPVPPTGQVLPLDVLNTHTTWVKASKEITGDGHHAAVEAIREFHLCLLSVLVLILHNCHYAPSITRGVISVSRLYKDGFVNRFDNDNSILVSRNNLVYFCATPRDDIFEINLSSSYTNDSSMYPVSNKRAKLNLDSILLWNCRLGYINKKRIEKLQHDGLLNSTDVKSFEKCVSCMSGMMARKPYSHQVQRDKDLLGLIHIHGPFKIMSRQGASYFITFTDNFSRYGYVYLLKYKHELFETFKVFQKEVENQLRKTIKSLHSNRGASGSLEDLEIIQEEDTHPSIDTSLHHDKDDQEIDEPQSDINPIRKSSRTRCALNRMCFHVNAEEHELGDLSEPANYKAALLDPKSDKWLNAMNVEMQSMRDNKVWDLVDHPPNGKTIGHKWLFKKKIDMDGLVHTYKAHLVAKGFTQTSGIDYEETFSLVADIRAIRILIAIAAFYDYKIWQMDVKTAFLNGYLNEEVYMEQREDLGEAAYILGIKIYRDRSKQLISLCQSAYIQKIMKRYFMENSKRRTILMQEKVKLSKSQGASTPVEKQRMQNITYALAVGSIMVSCYTDAGYLTDIDDLKSGYVFILNRGAVDWKSTKQIIFPNSSTNAEYIHAFDASKEAVWIHIFIYELGVVLIIKEPISMYSENTRSIEIVKDQGVTKGARHFHVKVHYLHETIETSEPKPIFLLISIKGGEEVLYFILSNLFVLLIISIKEGEGEGFCTSFFQPVCSPLHLYKMRWGEKVYSSSRSDLFHTSNQVVGCSNPTSGIKSSGLRVRWLTRIDQEKDFVVWSSGRRRRVSSVLATRFATTNFLAFRFMNDKVQRVKRMASMDTRINIEKLDGNIIQNHEGSKQVGFKQLGPNVKIGVHEVHDEKHVWFEVEMHEAQGDHEAEVF
nr:hypothetical protein [Tanacetum cinerariifolium]